VNAFLNYASTFEIRVRSTSLVGSYIALSFSKWTPTKATDLVSLAREAVGTAATRYKPSAVNPEAVPTIHERELRDMHFDWIPIVILRSFRLLKRLYLLAPGGQGH
jgi:hypothetical protein